MTEKIRRHPIAALLVWFFTVGQLLAFLPRIAETQGVELSVPLFVTASNLIGLLLPALALLTAPLFALQHAALVAGGSLAATLVLLLVLTLLAVPFRAVTGWLYNRTSSLLLVGLFHAAGNAAAVREWPGDGMLPLLFPRENFGPVHLLVSAVVGVIVIAATRGRLGEGFRRSRSAAAAGALAPGRAGGQD